MQTPRRPSFLGVAIVASMVTFWSYMGTSQPVTWQTGLERRLLPPDTGDDSTETYEPTTTPTIIPKDPFGNPYTDQDNDFDLGLEDPPGIKDEVEFTNDSTFTIKEKLGDQVDLREPSNMSYEEFMEYSREESRKQFFRDKNKTVDTEGEGEDGDGSIIPPIYLPKSLDRLFGGNYVDLRPNGSVMLDFGLNWRRTDNPTLPIQQQRNFNFRFDNQIAFNLNGKVGEKLRITANWDTKANFAFENNITVEYSGLEHEILKKVEAGNVAMPVNGSLIQGVNNLFGFKATMQFGKLTWTAVAAQQRGRRQQRNLQGGSQIQPIEPIRVDQYEVNKHYFLGHFFRDNYEQSLTRTPEIISGVVVNRIEVYKTNRVGNTSVSRNIVAFTDLGECQPGVLNSPGVINNTCNTNQPNDNNRNSIYRSLRSGRPIISPNEVDALVQSNISPNYVKGRDYELIRGATQLRQGTDYTFNDKLGYLSLNSPMRDDEVLAVAVEYTFRGQRYQIGEFASNYSSPNDQVVILKLLKPSSIQTRMPTWDLMMKNIYSLGASGISADGFRMQVVYRDDSTGRDNPVIIEGTVPATETGSSGLNQLPWIQLFQVDRLNPLNQLQPDGNWDFVEGVTVDSRRGRAIFPVLEPFGQDLIEGFTRREPNEVVRQQLIEKYTFQAIYDSTQADALLDADKAKFFLVGRMQSSTNNVIRIPPFATPGSVRITIGASQRVLSPEQYTVDYNSGLVTILDEGVLASGEDINVDFEQQDIIQFQPRSFFGSRFDYKLNENINLGATIMHLAERPVITRVSVGDEPANNTLWGVDANIRHESKFLTRAVDALPLIQTKEKSTVTVNAEFAQLQPGFSRRINTQNEGGTAYIDDFEGAETPYNMGIPLLRWMPSTTPIRFLPANANSPIENYYRRAHAAFYSIDNVFYRDNVNQRQTLPGGELNNPYVDLIDWNEIFKNRSPNAINLNQQTFDFAYYPDEPGIYNYNSNLTPEGRLAGNPAGNWAGFTRAVFNGNTDFDNVNVQYIQFWMMDPYSPRAEIRGQEQDITNQGELVFDLGIISEDLMVDNETHSFENGFPQDGSEQNLVTTAWGAAPSQPWVNGAFVLGEGARENQDIGLDGLNNAEENSFFSTYLTSIQGLLNPTAFSRIQTDPAKDDFQYFLEPYSPSGTGILDRYKYHNGLENNSPLGGDGEVIPSFKALPDDEDLNNDRQVNGGNDYYSYKINIRPDQLRVGSNYIADEINGNDGRRWYLVRIPIRNLNHPNASRTGSISDFKSIRYMRMYMTGFTNPIVVRMAEFELVANQWRPFFGDLEETGGAPLLDEESPDIVIGSVNIEENGATNSELGIPYTLPPDVIRDQDVASNVSRQLNESSMSLCIDELKDGEQKAVFKNGSFDFINYKRLKMFVSAQTVDENTRDGDLEVFLRIGTDFTLNYYEVSIPLEFTDPGSTSPEAIWPASNEFDVIFNSLFDLKNQRNNLGVPYSELYDPDEFTLGNQQLAIRGNPDLSSVTVLMIGIRNPISPGDRLPKSTCLWVNELRVTDFVKNNGWAATTTVNAKLADLANVTLTGRFNSIGYGALEDRISDRSRENVGSIGANATVRLDKFVPKKIGLRLPMYVGYERTNSDPQFDPLNPDRQINSSPSFTNIAESSERNEDQDLARDLTLKRSINFTNVGKEKTKAGAVSYPWDVENLNFTYAYSKTYQRNANIEKSIARNWQYGVGYNYTSPLQPISPFQGAKWASGDYLKLIKDFNISPLPRNIAVRADLNRQFQIEQWRAAFPGDNPLPYYLRAFQFNRTYNVGWALFRSLNLNYTANVLAVIDEPYGEHDEADRDTVLMRLARGGRTQTFNQNIRGNYRVPLRSIPALDWINTDLTYSVGYQWQGQPPGLVDSAGREFGNNIQNNREGAINGKFDLVQLYNKVGILKEINQGSSPPQQRRGFPTAKPKANEETDEDSTETPREWKALKRVARVLMSVRSTNFSYSITENTMLPGFNRSPHAFGFDKQYEAPTLPFLLGDQDPGIRETAIENRWLNNSTEQLNLFQQMKTTTLTARATVEPFKDFRIQFDARRTSSSSYSELLKDTIEDANYEIVSFNEARFGSYSITYVTLGSMIRNWQEAFQANDFSTDFNDEYFTPEYGRFLVYRQAVASRITDEIQALGNDDLNDTIPPRVVSANNQDALIPAFLAAYSGRSINEVGNSAFPAIPLPNWRIDYAGLGRMDFFKRWFSSINLTHAYVSEYSVSNFVSSLLYDDGQINAQSDPFIYQLPTEFRDRNTPDGEVAPVYDINTVSISERFSPLIGVNTRLNNKMTIRASYDRERNYVLNVNNAQMTELRAFNINFGLGFTKSGVKLPFITNKGRDIILKNDLNIRVDVTYRDNETIQRSVDNLINTLTDGIAIFQVKPTIGYAVSRRVNLNIYFDRTVNIPKVSNSFPTYNTRFGIQLRLALS